MQHKVDQDWVHELSRTKKKLQREILQFTDSPQIVLNTYTLIQYTIPDSQLFGI